MKSVLSRRQQITILVFTLLLHFFLLINMFMMQLHQQEMRDTMIKREPLITIEQESLKQQPLTEQNWVAVNAMNTAPTPIQSPPRDMQSEHFPVTHNTPEDSSQAAPSDANLNQAIALAQQILENQEQEIEEPNPIKSEQKQALLETTMIENSPSNLIEKKTISKGAAAKPKISFAQLAQGFSNHLEQAAMAVKSNTHGTASVEQLKQLHFCQKIIGCIVTAYKINKENTPHHKIMGSTLIKLALNENGTIHTLAIMQSSGNPAMDRFLLDIFKDASSSFPPVPASFGQRPYELPLFHIDRLEGLQSTNGWYINNNK